MHLVVVAGFQVVVSLVIGFVVFGRGGEFRIVRRDLLLDFGQLRFDRLDRPAQFAELLLLLLALLVSQFPRRRGVPVRSGLRGGFRRRIRRRIPPPGFAKAVSGIKPPPGVPAAFQGSNKKIPPTTPSPRSRGTRIPSAPCRPEIHGRAKRPRRAVDYS